MTLKRPRNASSSTVAAFDHDLSGRPISRTLNGVTKVFRFGGAIAYTPSGSPIEMDLGEVVIKLDGSTDRYRHMDFRGNVLFATTGNTVEGEASYRGFGRVWGSGQLGERGFAGGFELASLGLVVLGPRVLDSDTGRFLSQDPVFNAVNQYAYAQGNPVFYWDPTGRFDNTGLGDLAFVGSFTLSFITAGGDVPGSDIPGPGPPPQSNDGNVLAGAMLMMTGGILMEAGRVAFEMGVDFAPATEGTSAVAGTVAGGALIGAGWAEMALGAAICNDAGNDSGATGEAK